jgi:putative tryptophan/tyrosine transport system substrate-binding protein
MRELGHVEGKNLVIEWRSADGKFERLPGIIRELVALNVDAIVSPSDVGTKAGKAVTSTVPIVMVGFSFPVERGIVPSLARPGGNITGLAAQVSPEIISKRVELIKELVPNMRRLVFLCK